MRRPDVESGFHTQDGETQRIVKYSFFNEEFRGRIARLRFKDIIENATKVPDDTCYLAHELLRTNKQFEACAVIRIMESSISRSETSSQLDLMGREMQEAGMSETEINKSLSELRTLIDQIYSGQQFRLVPVSTPEE